MAALGLMLAGIGPRAAAAQKKPVTHKVTIDAARFQPAAIEAKVGDAIVWTNKDPYPHTVTSPVRRLGSKIAPDASWSYTAKRRESFPPCTLHQTMRGRSSSRRLYRRGGGQA